MPRVLALCTTVVTPGASQELSKTYRSSASLPQICDMHKVREIARESVCDSAP